MKAKLVFIKVRLNIKDRFNRLNKLYCDDKCAGLTVLS